MATSAREGWKLVFAGGSLAHNRILPYFLDIKYINERDPQIVIECGTMGLQYNENMAGGSTAPADTYVGDAVPGSDLKGGLKLELDEDNTFILKVEPQGFNVVEPTCVIVCPPFDGYPQSVSPFGILHPCHL